MMRILVLLLLLNIFCFSCKKDGNQDLNEEIHLRKVHDTIGFTQYDWQMDSIYKRLKIKDSKNDLQWKAAISPHDDYKYAGRLYYESLKGINANTIIF